MVSANFEMYPPVLNHRWLLRVKVHFCIRICVVTYMWRFDLYRGESGAGKTENTKKVIYYFAQIGQNSDMSSNRLGKVTDVYQQKKAAIRLFMAAVHWNHGCDLNLISFPSFSPQLITNQLECIIWVQIFCTHNSYSKVPAKLNNFLYFNLLVLSPM